MNCNSNWRNKPTNIDFLNNDIDYIIGIEKN